MRELILFVGGYAYGLIAASESVSGIVTGLFFSAAIEFAGRPERRWIGALAGTGVIIGLLGRYIWIDTPNGSPD